MGDIIKIKCPYCGAVLSVKEQPGMDKKSLTCPICKQKSRFLEFKRIEEKAEEKTDYPESESTGYDSGHDVDGKRGLNLVIAKLHVLPNGPSFQLKMGKNVIGRKATDSKSDIQIPATNKRMSREHLIIEVKKEPGKGFVHYLSLYKEKVNKTFVGNNKIEFDDCCVLKNGNIIKLPDTNVRFEIPDDEGTDLND